MYKVAFLSPLSPIKSGISYFAEDILPYMRENYELDIYVDGFKPTVKDVIENHKIFQIEELDNNIEKYDIVLYQIGNNPCHDGILKYAEKYPGVIFLHDISLHHLVAHRYLTEEKNLENYVDAMQNAYGEKVAKEARTRCLNAEPGFWETDGLSYPLNEVVVKNSLCVIVFSEFAKEKLLQENCNTPIETIGLNPGDNSIELTEFDIKTAKTDLGYNEDDILICSFGFIQPSKRPFELLEAFKILAEKNDNLRLVYIGKLEENAKSIKSTIKKYGLENKVKITGFTDEELFKKYLIACDINVSLRYPTLGETSAVLVRGFLYGKPSIITDIGSFSEYSDEFSIKISHGESEVDELVDAISSLIYDKKKYKTMSIKAKQYADENLILSITTKNMMDFINQIIDINQIRKTEAYNQIIKKYANTYYELNGGDVHNQRVENIIDVIRDIF